VLMEAAASGVAAIATDSGAPREIIDDGATGVLVPADAPQELAAAIARLHDAPDVLTAMSRAAYAKSSEFTWDRSIDILERVLEEAVADPARPS
jgi:glycosyltransferase involved in cell wall biosynthesis